MGESRNRTKSTTIDLGKKLVAVARSVGCLSKEEVQKLEDIRSALEKHRKEGMTSKNMKLIRQVLNGNVWQRVVNYPKELMKRARSQRNRFADEGCGHCRGGCRRRHPDRGARTGP